MARKRDENGEELETKFEVFMRNYKNVPGFRALIKLGLWLILFIIIIVISTSYKENDNKKINKVTDDTSITYKEILDKYLVNSKIIINIDKNNKKYLIDSNIKDNILSGTFETEDNTYKFIIKDNQIYEVKMNEEKENNNLFSEFNINFINIFNLINLLENNKSVKQVEDIITKYTYEIDGYEIVVNIIDEKINNIIITNNEINYNIVLEI